MQTRPARAAVHRGVQCVSDSGVLQGVALDDGANAVRERGFQCNKEEGSIALRELLLLIFEALAYPRKVPFKNNDS
jgi:hypothetical protein